MKFSFAWLHGQLGSIYSNIKAKAKPYYCMCQHTCKPIENGRRHPTLNSCPIFSLFFHSLFLLQWKNLMKLIILMTVVWKMMMA